MLGMLLQRRKGSWGADFNEVPTDAHAKRLVACCQYHSAATDKTQQVF